MRKTVFLFLLAMAVVAPLGLRAQDECSVTLPWSENFDSYTAVNGTSKPDCWTRLTGFQVNATTVRPNLYSYDGGKVLYFNGQGTGSGVMQIATPYINAALNNMEISFRCSGEGLMLYAAPDTADESTWVLIGTFGSGSMWSWVNVELHTDTISGMPADNGFLVFASAYGSSYGTGRLDDLAVTALTGCDKPASVSAENVGPATATISWDAVDGVPSYLVYYKADGDEDWVEVEEYTTSTALANLQPGTTYTVKVRSWCGVGDTSDVRSTTFTTQQSCYSVLNFAQTGSTFDAAAFSWEYSTNGFASTTVMAVLHDVTDPEVDDVIENLPTGATSHIFVNLDNTHNYEVTLYTICDNDTAEGVTSGIYFRSCGESPLSNGGYDKSSSFPIAPGYDASTSMMLYESDILFSMDTINGIALHRTTSGSAATRTLNIYMGHTVLDSLTSNPGTNGMIQVSTNHQYTLGVQEWDTLMFDTPFVFNGNSNVLVAINDVTGTHESGSPVEWYWHNAETKTYYSTTWNGSTSSFSAYHRPDIRFVGQCNNDMACNPPVVAVGEVDSMQAEINWVGPAGSEYIVAYRLQGETAWTVADTVYADSYILADLQPAAYYEVRVGLVCDTMVRYSNAVSFETMCALMHLPFHFTQGNMVVVAQHGNSFSSCWNFSQYIYKGQLTFSHRGYVRNVDLNQWIMLPAIAEPLSNARLRTWVGTSDLGYFKVGVVENGDITSAVWLDTIEVPAGNPDNDHNEYICYLDQYTGTGNRIVISPMVNNDYHYMYFFDFHIEEITECMPVRNLTLDTAGAGTLSFHWTPRGDATEWIVYIDGDSVATVANTPEYTATGLQPYTQYTVSVRSKCDEDDLSDPLSEVFRTGCQGDECYVTIVGHSSAGDGWHGSHLYVKANGEEIENFTLLQGSEKNSVVRVCQSMTISLTWLSVNDAEVCSFELVNPVGDTIYVMGDGSMVDDGELFATDSICTYDPSAVPACADRYEATVEEACDSYLWRGLSLTTSGTYTDTVYGVVDGECDSIYSLTLTVNHSVSVTIDTTAEDSFVWNGTIYSQSGNYTFEGQSAAGCDSTVTLNLIITHQGCDNVYDTVEATACDSYDWRGTIHTASGTFTSIVAGVADGGCDSIYLLNLTVNYSATSNLEASGCDSYEWRGLTLSASGMYHDTTYNVTAAGCDSIYSLNLVLYNSVSNEVSATASGSYVWNGNTYTQSGDYIYTGSTIHGCDSTVMLHLTITQGIDGVEAQMLVLYPNPASSVVAIDGIAAEATVRIVDVNGREAFRREGVTGSVKVDVSSFAKGVYFVCVVTPQSTAMQRLIVK